MPRGSKACMMARSDISASSVDIGPPADAAFRVSERLFEGEESLSDFPSAGAGEDEDLGRLPVADAESVDRLVGPPARSPRPLPHSNGRAAHSLKRRHDVRTDGFPFR